MSKKSTRGGPLTKRNINVREPRLKILIVCEGEKTEPNYFRSFELSDVIEVIGAGSNTNSVVARAMQENESAKKRGIEYEDTWVVFDKDSFLDHQFNGAITRAEAQGYKVAYSHQCFEIWYLLHFDFHTSDISRDQYYGMLSRYLGFPYKKNSSKMYEKLKIYQDTAIRNAKKLLQEYTGNSPAKNGPSTTVFKLIEVLNAKKKNKNIVEGVD
jgi:hypothetical protein